MASSILCSQTFSCRTAFKAGALPSTKGPATQLFSRRAATQRLVAHGVYDNGVGILATKAGMMSYFTEDGLSLAATVLALEEGNIVTQVKTADTDGYNSVQVGYRVVPEDKITKPELGHLKKSECPPMKHLKEFRLKDSKAVASYQPGQALDVEAMFKVGDLVDVAGVSIGKGFQGTIKRWNHKRGLMTHGSKSHRQHGSIGAATTPARVFPGLKMAGHMGNERVTVKQLQILKIDKEKNALVVKGAVPGKPGNVIEVTHAKRIGINWP